MMDLGFTLLVPSAFCLLGLFCEYVLDRLGRHRDD